MYSKPTAFIIGAGASWHYGYPTGAGLIKRMKTSATRLAESCEQIAASMLGNPMKIFELYPHGRPKYRALSEDLKKFVKQIERADPVVIDYFLGQNPGLAAIGRFLIAYEILSRPLKKAGF